VEYLRRVPDPPLDRFVDDIYCLSGVPRHRRLNVPPMPSAHLMINLAEPVHLYDSDPAVPPAALTDAWFMGVWSRRFTIEHHAPVHLVGVHFKSWGMAPFVDVPLTELRDRWVPLDAIWRRSADRLRDRLAGASSNVDMLSLLEDELRCRVQPVPSLGLELVDHIAGRVAASWGTVPVGALANDAGICPNHLAGQFKAHVGLTPKRVARIYRFARLILSVDARGPVEWAQLAQDAGYCDQAHFSKEFKAFTGRTPTAYLALRRRFPAEAGFPPERSDAGRVNFYKPASPCRDKIGVRKRRQKETLWAR
jgi:AraC-like DNA-binding protein